MIRFSRLLVVLGALVVLAAPAPLLAHGKGHVMGTVSAVDATHIEVKTKDGKTVSVTLTDKTKYKRGETAAANGDVKPGMRVSVHLAEDGSAGEVRLGSSAARVARRVSSQAQHSAAQQVLAASFGSSMSSSTV